jgi:hypothetical protein
MGFSTDAAGVNAVPEVQTTVFTHLLHIKAGKSVSVRLSGWKSLILGLSKGTTYYATVKMTDGAGVSAFAVDPNPLTV